MSRLARTTSNRTAAPTSKEYSVGNMSSGWSYLPPLLLVGAAFLVFVDKVGRDNRYGRAVRDDEASSPIRWAVIALLFIASIAHIPVIPEHLEEAPYMGVLFIAFTLAAFGVATAMAANPSRAWYLVTIALCTAAVGAYVATRLVAFPQLGDDVGAWTEPLGVVSICAETAAVVFSVLAVRHPAAQAPLGRDTRPGRA
jgi:hypothetical protein